MDFTKDKAVEWLRDIGLSVSGTRDELLTRIRKYMRYPNLVEKLKSKAHHNYTFTCSLDPLLIPPITGPWKTEDSLLPKVSQAMFCDFISHKKEGSLGQQEKAVRMLQSRKIMSVKVLSEDSDRCIYVKAMIKKSYGNTSRPAIILFKEQIPYKAHCNCPIGTSGLCCHILSLLLFLKHYNDTGEKIMELTCTQQLQKWHKRSSKGSSIPMMPLKNMKAKSAKRKAKRNFEFSPADPDKSYSYFKRDVTSIMQNLDKQLDREIPVNEHFYSVMSKSEVGRASSVGQHLCYKFKLNQVGDHQYVNTSSFESNVLNIEGGKLDKIMNVINKDSSKSACSSGSSKVPPLLNIDDILSCKETDFKLVQDRYVYHADCPTYKELEKNINRQLEHLGNCAEKILSLDLCFLHSPDPSGTNYLDVVQNTDNWKDARKYKITGSRLPSLLGIYGKKKFDRMWDIVQNGTQDEDLSGIENVRRGQLYEKEGIEYFEKMSKSVTKRCGFFLHPTNNRYGASPDALGPSGVIIEIKTRAVNSQYPIPSLVPFSNYYLQCQMQMVCTNAHSCILLSYHPESKYGNFFLIKRDNLIMDMVIDACDSILHNEIILNWYYNDTLQLQALGKKLLGKRLDFASLKPLRSHITRCTKDIVSVKFIDIK